MRIHLACPAPPHSRLGNRVTATRWARLLRHLGHRVTIGTGYSGFPIDVMIGLHARRSAPAIQLYKRLHPDGRLVVALTGTDLYRDIRISKDARRSLELADRLVLLQPRGVDELPAACRAKARVIYQSVRPLRRRWTKNARFFDVCVLSHLRQEKDPLRAALALRRLPETSRIRITHAGRALSVEWAKRARTAARRDPRYCWLGELPRWQARRLLARSRLLVLSSRMEGGANVISEAIVEEVPVLASRIAGSIGLLGDDYPGFFRVGDTGGLARLLHRAETEPSFYSRLHAWCARLAPRFEPDKERAAWRHLLQELHPSD